MSLKKSQGKAKGSPISPKLKRIVRKRHLTPEEADRDDKIREQVKKDFPPLEQRRRTPEETLCFIQEMCEHDASVEKLSDIQLVECLREEITNDMPMHTRDFALIAEAETRLMRYATKNK